MPGPAMPISSAINAYNQVANKGGGLKSVAGSGGDNPDDFAGLVKSAIQEAVRIGKQSEHQSIAAIKDKADLNQVVTAVAEAEVTLQTVVAVRDKVIDAYKEIMRMPI